MTTNATPPVKTAEDTKKEQTTPSAGTAPSTPPASKPLLGSDRLKQPSPELKKETTPPKQETPPAPETKKDEGEEQLTFHKEKFADYKLVRMYLKEGGRMQYDPQYPELKLNTCDKRGKLLPLTPFFKSRIGITLEIVL